MTHIHNDDKLRRRFIPGSYVSFMLTFMLPICSEWSSHSESYSSLINPKVEFDRQQMDIRLAWLLWRVAPGYIER